MWLPLENPCNLIPHFSDQITNSVYCVKGQRRSTKMVSLTCCSSSTYSCMAISGFIFPHTFQASLLEMGRMEGREVVGGGREGGRKGVREGGRGEWVRVGGREGGREGRREGGREGEREGREGGRVGGREGGREGRREGGRERGNVRFNLCSCLLPPSDNYERN